MELTAGYNKLMNKRPLLSKLEPGDVVYAVKVMLSDGKIISIAGGKQRKYKIQSIEPCYTECGTTCTTNNLYIRGEVVSENNHAVIRLCHRILTNKNGKKYE